MEFTPEEWRRLRKFTIEFVADALDVSPITWRKWEQKPSLIPIGKADEFCKLVGANPDQVSFLP